MGFLNFPVDSYFDRAKNPGLQFNMTAGLELSVLKLSMRFEEMKYTFIYQVPDILFSDLVSSVGGIMGNKVNTTN